MTIVNGQVADADAVMNVFGNMFYDEARLLWNTGVGDLKNVTYNSNGGFNIVGNIEYDSTNGIYWGPTDVDETEYTSYDEFNDSIVDSVKWGNTISVTSSGSGSVTESSSELTVTGSVASSGGSYTITLTGNENILANNNFVMININSMSAYQQSYGGGGAGSSIYIDNTLIHSVSISTTGTNTDNNIKIQLIKIDTIYYYRLKIDTGIWGGWTQINASGGIFKAVCSGSSGGNVVAGSATIKVSNIRFNTLATSIASTTNYITTNDVTSPTTITNSISTWVSYTDNNSSDVYEISYNSGSNYEIPIDGNIQRNTNQGTGLRHKWTLNGLGSFSKYATKYNLY